ncbi:MAG: ogr/Delta-like zinc finger family protein [Candidatus Phlomobacter fragariae]
MRCPVCKNIAHTRTRRYLTNKTKESYYQCQNIICSSTFKTLDSLARIIFEPETEENFTIVT